jgi:hypothetical protein
VAWSGTALAFLVKKSPDLYGTWCFTALSTWFFYRSLSRAR